MSLRLIAMGLFLATALEAQVPFGSPTQGNGFTPWLRAETPWMGNTEMAYTVGGGPPSGFAIIAASLGTQNLQLGNLNLLIGLDATQVLYAELHRLRPDGGLVIPRPLTFPPVLRWAGAVYHTQVAVTDGQLVASWATTNALTMELKLPPQAFVGNTLEQPQIVDPRTGQPQASFPIMPPLASPSLTAAVYGVGGRYLFLTDGQRLAMVDTSAASPAPTLLIASIAGQDYNGLRWDRMRRRLVTMRFFGELAFIDGNPLSPTFAQVLGETTDLGAQEELGHWDLSADGTRAMVTTPAGGFKVVEIDPVSSAVRELVHVQLPTYMHPTPFGPIQRFGIPWLSPEGAIVYVSRESEGLERYHLATQQWIDHNPTAPGIQPIGPASSPAVPLTGTTRSLTAADGSFTLVRAPGAVLRVDFDPLDAHRFAVQPLALPPSATGAWTLQLSPDLHHLTAMRLTTPISFFIPYEVEFYDLDSGTSLGPPVSGFGLPANVLIAER